MEGGGPLSSVQTSSGPQAWPQIEGPYDPVVSDDSALSTQLPVTTQHSAAGDDSALSTQLPVMTQHSAVSDDSALSTQHSALSCQ